MHHSEPSSTLFSPEQWCEYTLYWGECEGQRFYCLDFAIYKDVRDQRLDQVITWLISQIPQDNVRWFIFNPRSLNYRHGQTFRVGMALVACLRDRFDLIAFTDYCTPGYTVVHSTDPDLPPWSMIHPTSAGYGSVVKRWVPDRFPTGAAPAAAAYQGSEIDDPQ